MRNLIHWSIQDLLTSSRVLVVLVVSPLQLTPQVSLGFRSGDWNDHVKTLILQSLKQFCVDSEGEQCLDHCVARRFKHDPGLDGGSQIIVENFHDSYESDCINK